MKVGDTVKVRTAGHGEENVTVLNIEHPENEGLYILNDIVTVKHPSGAEAKYYRKHLRHKLLRNLKKVDWLGQRIKG